METADAMTLTFFSSLINLLAWWLGCKQEGQNRNVPKCFTGNKRHQIKMWCDNKKYIKKHGQSLCLWNYSIWSLGNIKYQIDLLNRKEMTAQWLNSSMCVTETRSGETVGNTDKAKQQNSSHLTCYGTESSLYWWREPWHFTVWRDRATAHSALQWGDQGQQEHVVTLRVHLTTR